MNIGELKETSGKSGKYLAGAISTLLISLTLELHPISKNENGRGPNYLVYAWGDTGIRVQVGAAWIKTMKRGPNAGDEFLTLTIDDPSLRHPLNVAAFKNPDSGNWDVMFRRRQAQSA